MLSPRGSEDIIFGISRRFQMPVVAVAVAQARQLIPFTRGEKPSKAVWSNSLDKETMKTSFYLLIFLPRHLNSMKSSFGARFLVETLLFGCINDPTAGVRTCRLLFRFAGHVLIYYWLRQFSRN